MLVVAAAALAAVLPAHGFGGRSRWAQRERAAAGDANVMCHVKVQVGGRMAGRWHGGGGES